MKRSFEMLGGKSAKFWEITVDGNSHTVRYGKLGAAGTTKTKTFADADKCNKDAEKMIASKVKKGYVEVEEQAAAAPGVDEAALAAELAKLDADGSSEARVVFGDWLQSVGHPWGQLISLDQAGKVAERDQLLASTPALLGDLARRLDHVELSWDHGFIDTALVRSEGNAKLVQQVLAALLAQPVARLIRRVEIEGEPKTMTTTRDWGYGQEDNMVATFGPQVVRELAKAPKSLRELAFGKAPPRGASGYVRAPKLAGALDQLPALETLEVQCTGGGLQKFESASLRRVELRLANAQDGDLQAIQASSLPALEQLSVWLGGTSHCTLDDVYPPDDIDDWDAHEAAGYPSRYPSSYDASDLDAMETYDWDPEVREPALREFCNAEWPGSLRRLGLQSASFDNASLEAVLSSGVLAQLTQLDLSGGAIKDEQAELFVRHAKQLEHLERLDLRRNHLSEAGTKTIGAALPNADCGEQRRRGSGPEFLMRYVACVE